MPAVVLLWGDLPWLHRLLDINVARQVRSIFNQTVRNNTAKRWNGVNMRRTTESDAANYRLYRLASQSLHAAGCIAEPLLVIATNRVFFCNLRSCMAMGRLFVAFLEVLVGNHLLEAVGEVQKFLYQNLCGVRLGAHNTLGG